MSPLFIKRLAGLFFLVNRATGLYPDGMKKPQVIYIAGEQQHAGKTVVCLGLISQLRKFVDAADIGYIKPVGQELRKLPDGTRVDKDAFIIQKFCEFTDMNLKMVSPVRIASGVTKAYLEQMGPKSITDQYKQDILKAYESMSSKRVIIAEGTGHPGVGGVVRISNAVVSRLLNARVVYLAGGGLGRALDEMDVKLSFFRQGNCLVDGVIFNKVLPDKRDQMKNLITEKFLNHHFDGFGGLLNIFGFLPSVRNLNHPSMALIRETCFPFAEAVGDTQQESWRIPCSKTRLISLPNVYYNPDLHQDEGQELIVSGAGSINRLRKILHYNATIPPERRIAGIILTCAQEVKRSRVQRQMLERSGIPTLFVTEDTTQTDAMLYKCFSNTKLQLYDSWKHEQILKLFEQYFDSEKFVRVFGLKD
ncbi:MAG: AAA family ATPase [Kiritimatiellae bacterium]|nr:AAA family ATPase [Kiritimatiellia bacterium]